jgi:hypothetical protein
MTKAILILSCIIYFSCRETSFQKEKVRYEYVGNDTIKVIEFYWHKDRKESVLRYKGNKLHGICESYFLSGTLKSRKTFFNDEPFGIFTQYFPSGVIRQESFLIDSINSTYDRVYDSAGHLIREEGTPQVKTNFSYTPTGDSINVDMLFSINKIRTLDCEISIESNSFNRLPLIESKYPNVVQGNLRFTTPNKKRNQLLLKIITFDSFNKSTLYNDTINFSIK